MIMKKVKGQNWKIANKTSAVKKIQHVVLSCHYNFLNLSVPDLDARSRWLSRVQSVPMMSDDSKYVALVMS